MPAATPSAGPLDRLLDLTVVPGFSRIGWELRRRAFEPLPDASGRTVVITGGTGGLGLAAAVMCARAGASLVLLGRDAGRGRMALDRLEPLLRSGQRAGFVPCDMADLDSVRRTGANLSKSHPRIDALVLNAGVLLQERTITPDGIELAWATNVVGPYLLEHLLLDSVVAAHGRVVMVTSGGAYTEGLAFPDGDLEGADYDGPAVYARTKRAQIALAQLQASQFEDLGVAVHAVHPGWADTPGVQTSLPTFRKLTRPLLRSADQGADSIAWLALADPEGLGSGLLWHDRRPRPRTRLGGRADTAADRAELDAAVRTLARL